MTLTQFIMIFLVVLGIASGQVLFKLAANSFQPHAAIWKLIVNPYMILAGLIYFICTGLWLWQLRFVELNKAYPMFAMSFLMVPFFSWIFFDEKISVSYFLGVALVILGVVLATR